MTPDVADIVRKSYGPQVQSLVMPEARQLAAPPGTDALTEAGEAIAVNPRTVVRPTSQGMKGQAGLLSGGQDELYRRGMFELEQLGIENPQLKIQKYLLEDKYRTQIQAAAEARGVAGKYQQFQQPGVQEIPTGGPATVRKDKLPTVGQGSDLPEGQVLPFGEDVGQLPKVDASEVARTGAGKPVVRATNRDRQASLLGDLGEAEVPPNAAGFVNRLEAPAPRVVTRERTIDDIRQELMRRGVADPSDQLVASIKRNPKLLDKIVPPEQVMEGVTAPQVRGLLPAGTPEIERRAVASEKAMREARMAGRPLEDELPPGPTITPQREPLQPDLFNPTDVIEDTTKKTDEWIKRMKEKYGPDVDLDDPEIRMQKVAAEETTDPHVRETITRANESMTQAAARRLKSVGMSMETEMDKQGGTAADIANLMRIVRTDAPIEFDRYTGSIIADARKLGKEKFEQVVDYIEGKTTGHVSDEIRELGDRMRTAFHEIGKDAQKVGALETGLRQDYWPQMHTGVPRQALIDALMSKKGMTQEEAINQIDRIRRTREMKVGSEYARELEIPGYRKDIEAFEKYMHDMTRRIQQAKHYGVKDTADVNSPISRLIAASPNPERSREIMEKVLRGPEAASQGGETAAKWARNLATAGHLSLAGISNFGGLVPIAVRTTLKDTAKGMVSAWKKDPLHQYLSNTNAYRDAGGNFNEGMSRTDWLYEKFGIKKGQNYLNRVASAAGYGHAKDLFSALKVQENENAIKRLEDLTLTKWEVMKGQKELSDLQLKRAMNRMTEITQAANEREKLPYYWVNSGVLTIPQIFQRTAFQTSKALYDGIKQDPVRAVPKALLTGALVGNVITKTKEGVKTVAQVGTNSLQQAMGITNEDKNFAEEWTKNVSPQEESGSASDAYSHTRRQLKAIDPRLAKNQLLVQALGDLDSSFTLGMPGLLMTTAGQMMFTRNPAEEAMRTMWFWDEGSQILDSTRDVLRGNLNDPAREVWKRAPFVGRGSAREWDTTAKGRNSGGYQITFE